MMTKSDISLCMIVKNESDVLDRCLRSVTPLAKELILVDTGSTDDTCKIAKLFGAKTYSYPWNNDFAAARNFSISHARCPWILILDADEVVSPRDHPKLFNLLETNERVAYSFTARNYLQGSGQITWNQRWQVNSHEYEEGEGYSGYLDHPVVRLFPRDPQIRYSSQVHEGVEGSLAKAGCSINPSNLILHHYGQVRKPERMKYKKDLYLEIGLEKLSRNPQNARAHFELGIQYQELQRFAEAIPHYQKAKNLDSSYAMADLYLGICLSRLGQFESARHALLLASLSLQNCPGLWFELGMIDLKQSQLARASANFQKALDIDPNHVASLCYQGSILVQLGRVRKGIALMERSVTLDEDYFESWVNLGLAWRVAGDADRSIRCFRKAHDLRPGNWEVTKQLALALANLQRAAEAADLLGQFALKSPEDEQARMLWATALAVSGENNQARKIYQEIWQKGGKLSGLAGQQIERTEGTDPNLAT